jgi:hypothetical protein
MMVARNSRKDSSENAVRILLTKEHNLSIENNNIKTAWKIAKKYGTRGTIDLIEHALNQPNEALPPYREVPPPYSYDTHN